MPDQLLFGEAINVTVLLAVIAAVSFLVGLWLGSWAKDELHEIQRHFGDPDHDL